MQPIELNQPITGNDLARLLEGDSGTYLAQNGSLNFIVVAGAGHSIKSLRPVGTATGLEQWTVTKISSQDVSEEQLGNQRTSAAGQQR